MTNEKKFPDFEVPKVEEAIQDDAVMKIYKKVYNFCDKKFGSGSKVTNFIKGLKPIHKENALDSLSHLKKRRSSEDKISSILTIILIIVLIFMYMNGADLFAKIDQKRNDIKEQDQVIKMEKQNNEFLEKLAKDKNVLIENLYKVYAAVPDADEKSEEIIAMLEDMTMKNRMVIDSIGIRKVPESQFYYDDLFGITEVYEYNFSVESDLPNILSFISSMRTSLRIMDIMTLEIEEGKGVYKADFSVYVYHLADEY